MRMIQVYEMSIADYILSSASTWDHDLTPMECALLSAAYHFKRRGSFFKVTR